MTNRVDKYSVKEKETIKKFHKLFDMYNTEIENDTFEFIISKNQTLKHDLPIAYASSRKGIILVRLTMKNFDEYDELDKFRRTTIRKYL